MLHQIGANKVTKIKNKKFYRNSSIKESMNFEMQNYAYIKFSSSKQIFVQGQAEACNI